MPIYEYRCVACGREIEVIHGIHAEGPSNCDVCGSPMRKLVSTSAIVFRGGGWAKKDARDSRSARSADGPSAEAATSSTEAEKSPARDGKPGRDKPAETAEKPAPEKGTSGRDKASKPSGSDD